MPPAFNLTELNLTDPSISNWHVEWLPFNTYATASTVGVSSFTIIVVLIIVCYLCGMPSRSMLGQAVLPLRVYKVDEIKNDDEAECCVQTGQPEKTDGIYDPPLCWD